MILETKTLDRNLADPVGTERLEEPLLFERTFLRPDVAIFGTAARE
jgi:hypothetical protein